jgi:hypothetical protein
MPAAKVSSSLADLHAIVSDRALRTALARRLKSTEKTLPSTQLGPLGGAGIPRGTKVLTLSVPAELRRELGERVGTELKKGADRPSQYAIAVVPDGIGSIVGVAPSAKELAARLGPVLNGKGRTLADRPELQPLREINASAARFTTIEGLSQELAGGSEELRRTLATLPGRGRVPIVMSFTAQTVPTLAGRLHVTVPAGVFGDIPGLLLLAGQSLGGVTDGPLMKKP